MLPKVSNVSGAALWPAGQTDGTGPDKEPASVHFERLIRQLAAQGYTDAEIEGGLQTVIHNEFSGH